MASTEGAGPFQDEVPGRRISKGNYQKIAIKGGVLRKRPEHLLKGLTAKLNTTRPVGRTPSGRDMSKSQRGVGGGVASENIRGGSCSHVKSHHRTITNILQSKIHFSDEGGTGVRHQKIKYMRKGKKLGSVLAQDRKKGIHIAESHYSRGKETTPKPSS